ncbi:MAG: hypothetical protein ACTSRI_21795 [Promethearchaeota archaeon]
MKGYYKKKCEWCGTEIKTTDDLVSYFEEGIGRKAYCKYCGARRRINYDRYNNYQNNANNA